MELAGLAGFLKIAAGVAIGLPLVMYLAQDSLLFYKQPLSEGRRADVAKRHPQAREIFLQAKDGAKIHAWHLQAGAPLVIYFGGNAEEVSWMLDEAPARAPGVSWLLVDYRGYGGSEGSPSEENISADALAWYDHALQHLATQKVIAFGRSLGSGAAVYLASQRKLEGVVLVTPYDSLVAVAGHHYPWLPVNWMLRHRFDSIGHAPKLTTPLLCVAASRDDIIPMKLAKRLYDAWGGPKRWVGLEEAGHNTTDSHPLFWQNVASFLAKPGL